VIQCSDSELTVLKWNSEAANAAGARHFCREAHAQALLPLATIGKLIELLPEPTKSVVVLIVFGSLRIGEVLALKRVREYPRPIAPPRATAKCDAFSINAPTLQCGRKEASSRSCIAASYYAWDTIRPLGQLPIGFVA